MPSREDTCLGQTEPTEFRPRGVVPLARRWRLRLSNAALTLETLCVLAAARVCVRFCFRRIAAWTFRMEQSGSVRLPLPPFQARLSRAIRRAARMLPGTSRCLSQAIAGKWLLERRGFNSVLHVGVSAGEGKARHAHAWLEVDGRIVTGADGVGAVTRIPR